MIRPATFVTAVMMLSSGAWMFVVKHQAEQLDKQIGGVTARIRASEQRVRVLRAEWALETDPNRLARLAALFMPTLVPMRPDQLVTWNQLADRLPPPGAAVPHLPLPPPLPDQLSPATGPGNAPLAMNLPLPPTPSSAPSKASPAQPSPVRLAAAKVAPSHPAASPHAVIRQAAAVIRRPAPKPAQKWPAPKSVQSWVTPKPTQSWRHPVSLGGSVLASARPTRPLGAQVMTVTAPPRPLSPMPAPASGGGSVFGGYAANLPPPRPVGGAAP